MVTTSRGGRSPRTPRRSSRRRPARRRAVSRRSRDRRSPRGHGYPDFVRKFVLVGAVLAAVLVGVPAGASATAHPAAVAPSRSAKMICSGEGQKDVAAALGGAK